MSTGATAIAGLAEIIKLLIILYIQSRRQEGATPEQIEAELAAAKAAFAENKPELIPDV